MGLYISTSDLVVSDDFIHMVLKVLGATVVTNDMIYSVYPLNDIKSDIATCLETYYNYFPIITKLSFPNATTGSYDHDLENVLGIVHVSKGDTTSSGGLSGNAWATLRGVTTSSTYGSYGTRYGYGTSKYSQYMNNFLNNSVKNMQGGCKYSAEYDELNDKINIINNGQDTIYVDVGCYSCSFDDIPKRLRGKVLALCQAKIGLTFADTANMLNIDLPLSINIDDLKDKCQDLWDNTIEWLQNNSHVAVKQ